jgi:hypothetical protein
LSQTGNRNTTYNRVINQSGNALYFYNHSGSYYTTGQVDNLLAVFLSDMSYKGIWSMAGGTYPT